MNSSNNPENVMGCVEDMLSDERCRNGDVLDKGSHVGSCISALSTKRRVVLISCRVVLMPWLVT